MRSYLSTFYALCLVRKDKTMDLIQTRNNNLNHIFNKTKMKLSEVHIEIYSENPYVLFLRSNYKKITSLYDGKRLILKDSNQIGTYISNIAINEIQNVEIKEFSQNQFELILTMNNLIYKMLIIN